MNDSHPEQPSCLAGGSADLRPDGSMHGSHSETEGTQTTSEAVPSTTWVQHNDTCSDVYHHHQYNDTLYDDKFYNLVHDVVDHHNGFLYYYDSGEQ